MAPINDAMTSAGRNEGNGSMGMPIGGGFPAQHGRFADPSQRAAALIQRADSNGNGSIDLASEAPRVASRLATADGNADGLVSAEELVAHFEARRAQMAAGKTDPAATTGATDCPHAASGEESTAVESTTTEVAGDSGEAATSTDVAGENGEAVLATESEVAPQAGGVDPTQSAPGKGGFGHFRHVDPATRAARMIGRLDTNGNGAIDLASEGQRMAQRLAGADANGDGAVTAEELAARIQARRDGSASSKTTEVAGDSGEAVPVTQSEVASEASGADPTQSTSPTQSAPGKGWRFGQFRNLDPATMAARMIGRLDTDGSGAIDLASEAPRMAQRLAGADANGDGAVTAEELAAQIQARRDGQLSSTTASATTTSTTDTTVAASTTTTDEAEEPATTVMDPAAPPPAGATTTTTELPPEAPTVA